CARYVRGTGTDYW
nr:immunoglobulin heavy chain junction region [Macaca mulatta]